MSFKTPQAWDSINSLHVLIVLCIQRLSSSRMFSINYYWHYRESKEEPITLFPCNKLYKEVFSTPFLCFTAHIYWRFHCWAWFNLNISKFSIMHNHNVFFFQRKTKAVKLTHTTLENMGSINSLTLEQEEDAPAGCFNNKKATKQRLLKLLLQALE